MPALGRKVEDEVIRCTANLQKEMGLKKNDLVASVEESTRLGGWHANLEAEQGVRIRIAC
jgi:hypothetical protein